MTTVVAGLAGGVVATVVMTIVMMMLGDGGPPPTAGLVAKFAGGEAEDYAMPGMVLHLVYGIAAGVVFIIAALVVGVDLGTVTVAIGAGVVYGIVLMIVGMVFWMRLVIEMEPDRDMMLMFGVVHVVYGIVLGAFVGAGILS